MVFCCQSNTDMLTNPVESDPNKGPSARCRSRQENETVWFRSEGKLYSSIREWRGVRSCSGVHALPPGGGRGCFLGLPRKGRGRVLIRHAQLCCSGSGAQGQAQRLCLPPPFWVACGGQHFCTPSGAEASPQPFRTGNSGLRCLGQGLCTRHPMSTWD